LSPAKFDEVILGRSGLLPKPINFVAMIEALDMTKSPQPRTKFGRRAVA
jgi:hypothetical protein